MVGLSIEHRFIYFRGKIMNQAAILSGVILMMIGLIGYFGHWIEPSATDAGNDIAVGDTAESRDNNAVAEPSATTGPEIDGQLGRTDEDAAKSPSPTALIPAFIGLIMLLCGLVSTNERSKKHAMHIAAGVALLGGIAGLVLGIPRLIHVVNQAPEANPRAVIFIWLMTLVCFGFLYLAIKSFIAARRGREASKA